LEIKEYWKDIDDRLKELSKRGFVKFPSIDFLNLDNVSKKIYDEMGNSIFFELGLNHKLFLENLLISKYLVPKLFNMAKNIYNFKGKISDQYHIARKVDPGNSKEFYRAHFDSHLFTMVFPIRIPPSSKYHKVGELIYFPNSRSMPKNEISNFIGKAYHKKYASEDGVDKFSENNKKIIDNFESYEPLLFIGNTTLHTNMPVSSKCSSYRLTLLAHFFDPSPKYGIGTLLRFVRQR
tara:strand:- start:731 stop:1438 length:708 start_codon:yes stop_codon:yes gene_type:complete